MGVPAHSSKVAGYAVANGLQQVWVGGVADATTVSSGGTEQVYGSASGTTVLGGGLEIVVSGGSENGTVISANGLQQVSVGGVGNGAQVSSARPRTAMAAQ
jgi:fibronectin-binding autotransporter adhesin